MTLNHHKAGQLLSAYLDGELSASETAAVQEHLMDCAACREMYGDLRVTKGVLGELPPAEPPAEFWAAVREPGTWAYGVANARVSQYARRGRWGVPARVRWRLPALVRRPAWAVAAVLVVLALAAVPMIKGTVDRLHAGEIGVDLYVREHALEMSTEPLADRAYLGLIAGDADLVLVGETPRAEGGR